MTTALHGGFDQVFEISAGYVAGQVRRRFPLTDSPIAVDTAQQKLSGLIGAQIHDVWLAAAAERFDAATGAWSAAQVAAATELVLGVELSSGGSGLVVERVTVPVNGNPVTLPIPADHRRLDVHAGVVLHLPIVAETLHVRGAATDAFPADAHPSAALVVEPADPTRAGRPGATVEITLDESSLKASPFVSYLVGIATAFMLDLEMTVMVPLRAELTRQIGEVVTSTLRDAADSKAQESGRLLLYSADSGVKDAAVLVQTTSLRVLLTLGGPGGDTTLVSRSLLGAGDALAVCMNGTSLLRDVVRDVVRTQIFDGLTAADFVAGEPCTIATRELVTFVGKADELILVYLQAGINDDEDLVLWFQVELNALATTVLAEVEVPVTLTAKRVLTQDGQALSITEKIGTATIASLAKTSVPGWGHIVQAAVNGKINEAVGNVKAPAPLQRSLPAGTELRVSSFSMHQDDAPTGTRTKPDIRLIGEGWIPEWGDATLTVTTTSNVPPTPPAPARWMDHDLVVTFASRDLPPTMTVTCAVPDSADPGKRIDGLGGTYKRGARDVRWSMSSDAAIEYLRQGGTLWVNPSSNDPTYVEIVEANPPYLRTRGDTTGTNNLLALPACPLVADGPINDISGDSTVTLFSPTQVHWRDVLPFGDKGDEMVNQGAKASSACTVATAVVELIDRQGTVLASGGPGVDIAVSGAGARLIDNPAGGRSLAVKVHWWFDAYCVCRYRVRYVVTGTGC